MSISRVLFSAADDAFGAAGRELRTAFPAATVTRLGPDAGSLEAEDLTIGAVAAACRSVPVVFVRHLMAERMRLPVEDATRDPVRLLDAALGVLSDGAAPPDPALHVWASNASPLPVRTDDVRRTLATGLAARGYDTARSGRDTILSVCLTRDVVLVGWNGRDDALADWPGGRVALAKRPEQVSRAEFKLEEAARIFGFPPAGAGEALDLGASPGGWTRILRQWGYEVWAVDPADLDPRIAADSGVRHVRNTAGPFLAETDRRFDLVANDMRMVPSLSCAVTVAAADRLRPGGRLVMTLKLPPGDSMAEVRRSLATLATRYDDLRARQLFHNRHEVTVVGRKRDG